MAESRILGPDGKPIRKEDLNRELAASLVVSIRSLWRASSVAGDLEPERLASLLQGAIDGDAHDYLTLAEEMEEREPHYGSVLGTRKRALLGLGRIVEAASDDPHDVELADAVRDHVVNRPAFGRLISALSDALGKGYSVSEIFWDTQRKPWMPRDQYIETNGRRKKVRAYEWRDPRFFMYDRESGRELRLLDNQASMDGVPLAPYRFIVHEPQLKMGLPIRSGLARLVAAAYMCSSFTLADWMAFADVFGIPIRLGRYQAGAKPEDIQTLIAAVANLGSDAAAVLPDSMRIEFQNAVQGAGGPEMFKNLAEHLHKLISKAVLGQTATADETPGRLGNASEKQEVRLDILEGDAGDLESTLNEQLVVPFVDLNYGPQERYPWFRLHIPKKEDLQMLITALEKLVPMGLEVEQSVVRDKFGLPDPDPQSKRGGKLLMPPAPPPAFGSAPQRTRYWPGYGIAANRVGLPQPDAIDVLAEDALADWEPMLEPILDPVRQFAERAGSYEEFLAELPMLLERMDAGELVRRLAEAAFKARGMGDGTDDVNPDEVNV